MKKQTNIAIFIPHLACNNSCIFCNQNRISGEKRVPTLKEIEFILENAKPNPLAEIAFFGGSFTGIEEILMREYLAKAQKYIDNKKFFGIRISTRPDYINEKILNILKEYSVTTIELGVQSMNNDVLNASKRGHNSNDTVKAVALIKQYGFSLVLQMMVGMYKDNYEGVLYSADKISKLKPNAVRIYPTVVIKDTELGMLYKEGLYKPLSKDETVNLCSELLLFFEGKGIKVIRLGLHSEEGLCDGSSVVAGFYHPAFRELCESKIFLDIFKEKIPKNTEKITIFVSKGNISKAIGQNKENIIYLKANFNLKEIYIKEDEKLKGRETYIM